MTTRNSGSSAKPHHVLEKLQPQEKQAALGILEVTVLSQADDAGLEVMINLLAHFRFDVGFGLLGIGDAELIVDHPFAIEVLPVVFEDVVEAIFPTGQVVPFHARRTPQSGGEREIGGAPDMAFFIPRGNRYESEGDINLFAEANGSDGALFRIPVEAEGLAHAVPLPAAIRDVLEALLGHGGGGFGGFSGGGGSFGGGGASGGW